MQELINGKMISGQYKDHPEFPGNIDTSTFQAITFYDIVVFTTYGCHHVLHIGLAQDLSVQGEPHSHVEF